MKKTLYTPLLTAALLLAASCANDPVEEVLNPSAPGTHLPGDTFIIDYAASTGEADTRADANQRIQSLDYLVYQSTDGGTTYTLLKRRAIPDINTSTRWPLTRETMTWAQREALKDTLNTSCMYKMVFVANAADWIWEKENATPPSNDALENSSDKVLLNANLPTDGTEAPKFEDGRLILPPRVFEGNDMYYMETVEVDGKNYTGEKTAYMNVLLKRMINKVEVKLDEEAIIGDKNTLDESINAKVESYYNNLISDSYVDETTQATTGKLYDSMKKCMEALAEGLDNTTEYFAQYNKAVEQIQNRIKEPIFIKSLCDKYLSKSDKEIIKTQIETYLENLYHKYCDWTKANKVEIVHKEGESYANALDFNRITHGSEDKDAIIYDLIDKSFIYYTFGNNHTGETNINQVKEFNFYYQNGQNKELKFTISGTTFPIDKHEKGNLHLIFKCNPIGIQTPAFGTINTDEISGVYEISNFDLTEEYGSWTNDTFEFWGGRNIDEFTTELNNGSSFDNNDYIEFNGNIKDMTLKIMCPEVSFSPTWSDNNE